MKRHNFTSIFLMIAVSSTFCFSCTNNQKNESSEESLAIGETENFSNQDTVRITLNSNDKMQFDKAVIKVHEGQTVVLTLHHTGTMPAMAMGHNFVLLTNGTSISKFAMEAMKAKENDYIPADQSNVIAHTGLIGGGESDTITFKAPKKGTYDFLCSFPGHYSIMKGKFHVQ